MLDQKKSPRGSLSPSLEVASGELLRKVCKEWGRLREIPPEKPPLHTTIRTSCSRSYFGL